MKTRLIKQASIKDFAEKNARSRTSLQIWLTIIKMADWKDPADIIRTFGSADLLGNGSNRVVFNIGGNHFRLICKYHFGFSLVHLYVKWIGAHGAYDEICRKNLQFTISQY